MTTRTRLLIPVAALALVAAGTLALAAKPKPMPTKAGPKRVEKGQLVIEEIPEIPARIGERIFQYQNSRGAGLSAWAPDGKGMLISTRFAETSQVHFVASPSAARTQWTFFDEPVFSAFFDEKRGTTGFYYVRDVGGGEFYQLYWYDRASGRSTIVTDGKSRNEGFTMAEGGGLLAFVSTQRNGKDFDLYLYDGSGAPRLVKQLEGDWNPRNFSPDRKQVLLQHYVSINESYLWLLDLASGQLTEINPQAGAKKIAYGGGGISPKGDAVYYTSDEDSEYQRLHRYDLKTGKKTVLTGDIPWDVNGFAMSRNGKHLAYTVNEGGRSALYVGTLAAPKKARKVALPIGVVGSLQFDPQSKRLGFNLNGATAPADVFSVDVGSLKLTRWTESEVGGLDPKIFVEPTLIEFESFDKKKIPAWYYKPRGASADKPVAVIIDIHGGPESQAMAVFNPIAQYNVNELGIAVLVPNVRGSAGYGKSYLLLDNGFGRQDSVKDIGGLLDWIAKQPELDKARVGVQGGSYGGFMVLASLVMFGDRIRCGIDVVGISHFVTFLQNTQDYRRDLRRAEYGDERDPKMKQFLHEISPLTNAKKIKVPLYVVQGLNDPRVPASEAEQIVGTVRKNGGKVWYLLAKDEGHGFRKKVNRDYLTDSMALFWEEFLLQ